MPSVIVRTPHTKNYTMIANGALGDERLSWKARGLLAYLLSKPDNWRVIVAHLVTQGPDGKTSVMAGLEELETAGYIRRTKRPSIGGRYDGYDTELYESPDETASGFSTSNQGRKTVTENQPVIRTNTTMTDLTKKEDFSKISHLNAEREPAPIAQIVDLEAVKARRQKIMPSIGRT